jgi:hypothetical protein
MVASFIIQGLGRAVCFNAAIAYTSGEVPTNLVSVSILGKIVGPMVSATLLSIGGLFLPCIFFSALIAFTAAKVKKLPIDENLSAA